MFDVNEARKECLEELKVMLSKKNKTIKDHIEIEFKRPEASDVYYSVPYEDYFTLYDYYEETHDNTILTEDEFEALSCYSSESAKSFEDIKNFINSMKFYDIKDTAYLTLEFAHYYKYSIVNLNQEEQLYLKEMIRKSKEENNLEYRECAANFIKEKAKEFLPKRNNRKYVR